MTNNEIDRVLAEKGMGWEFFQLGQPLPDLGYGGSDGYWTERGFRSARDWHPTSPYAPRSQLAGVLDRLSVEQLEKLNCHIEAFMRMLNYKTHHYSDALLLPPATLCKMIAEILEGGGG
jgi:hypothetical protein